MLKNLEIALTAGGPKLEHVIKWNVYIVHGQSPLPGFEAFRYAWGDRPNPPTITALAPDQRLAIVVSGTSKFGAEAES